MRISDWSSDVCSSDLRGVQTLKRPSGQLQFEALDVGLWNVLQNVEDTERQRESLGTKLLVLIVVLIGGRRQVSLPVVKRGFQPVFIGLYGFQLQAKAHHKGRKQHGP